MSLILGDSFGASATLKSSEPALSKFPTDISVSLKYETVSPGFAKINPVAAKRAIVLTMKGVLLFFLIFCKQTGRKTSSIL